MTRRDVDIRHGAALRTWVAEHPVDGVIHLAALTKARESWARPIGYWRTNVAGTMNLIDALEAAGLPVPLVFASTSGVYDHFERNPVSDAASPCPGNPYAGSKYAAEQILRWHMSTGTVRHVSLRCFNVVGGWQAIADPDRTRIVNNALAVAAGEKPELVIHGDGSDARDFVHVWDVAEAFRLALAQVEDFNGAPFNIGSGVPVSLMQVVATARRVTGHPIPTVHEPAKDGPRAIYADITATRRELGWAPQRSSIDEIVRDAWEAMQGGTR